MDKYKDSIERHKFEHLETNISFYLGKEKKETTTVSLP